MNILERITDWWRRRVKARTFLHGTSPRTTVGGVEIVGTLPQEHIDGPPTSGTWSASLTAETNIGTLSVSESIYSKIGNVVRASILFTGTPAGAGTIEVLVDLPVAATLSFSNELLGPGVACPSGAAGIPVIATAHVSSNQALVTGYAASTSAHTFAVDFTYQAS